MTGYGSGKSIKSGPNDHIFVYYSDHGGPGVLAFPIAYPPLNVLKATDLVETIKDMHTQGKYGKMLLYIDACYSGSMFEGLLPDDINVYAVTAANATQESYSCFCDIRNLSSTCIAGVFGYVVEIFR